MRASMLSLLLLFVDVCAAAPAADGIPEFPDFGPPPTPHYSGFLSPGRFSAHSPQDLKLLKDTLYITIIAAIEHVQINIST
jgi:hypothetical protein